MQRYRVNASVGDLKYGELVEIDADEPYWQGLIDAGFLRKVEIVDAPERPARLAVPDAVPDAVIERPDPTRVIDGGTLQQVDPDDESDELVTQVRRALVAHPDETNAQIAERTGSSRRLVGKVRRGEA